MKWATHHEFLYPPDPEYWLDNTHIEIFHGHGLSFHVLNICVCVSARSFISYLTPTKHMSNKARKLTDWIMMFCHTNCYAPPSKTYCSMVHWHNAYKAKNCYCKVEARVDSASLQSISARSDKINMKRHSLHADFIHFAVMTKWTEHTI